MVVELKIKKKNPWGNFLKYKNCYDYISPYFTRSGSVYTGLTPEDERRFEKILGYPEGHLARTSEFWNTFCVKVGAYGVILDDERPLDQLKIKFLSGHKRVATSLEKFTANKDYLLINREAEAVEANKINKIRRDALREFDKLSLDQMRRCLRLFGRDGQRMSNELAEKTLFDIVDKQPQRFLDKWVNNTKKETEVLLEDAIAKGVIRKDRTQYYYGTEMFADTLDDAISYLDAKKNQDLKLSIINEVKNK